MLGQIEDAFRARERSEMNARASEERMRRFVADAGHELRTPLTSVRGFAELYRMGAVADEAELARVMKRIEDEATRMGLLVEDLLLLARLDQQRPLERQPVELLALATDAVSDLHALHPERDLRLVTDPPASRPVVIGDEGRLRQVLGNLLANAVTHTPPDTHVRCRSPPRDRTRCCGRRRRPGHAAGGHRPRLRALLPGRPLAGTQLRRLRAGAVDRRRPGRGARRHVEVRQQAEGSAPRSPCGCRCADAVRPPGPTTAAAHGGRLTSRPSPAITR